SNLGSFVEEIQFPWEGQSPLVLLVGGAVVVIAVLGVVGLVSVGLIFMWWKNRKKTF
ncbi:MAG: hypothetical protein HY917_05460, partial [Candidatus Diapherotrites archaeon]|nr:hypothetical protein [Candidatus Diapherotrites archaeon]